MPFEPKETCPFYNDPEFQEAWQDWRKVRKQAKCIMSDRAEKRHLLNLMELSGGDKGVAIKIVDQSVDGGQKPWTKLYPLKQDNGFISQGTGVFKKDGINYPEVGDLPEEIEMRSYDIR